MSLTRVSPRRILVVKLSAMGDIVHALPVSAALGRAFPQAEIIWVTHDAFLPLLDGNPWVTQVISVPRSYRKYANLTAYCRRYFGQLVQIRKLHCDVSIDLQGLAKSAVVVAAAGARTRIGHYFQRECLARISRPVRPNSASMHVVDQYLDVAYSLGGERLPADFPLAVSPADEASARELLRSAGIQPDRQYVVINPAAGRPIKQWPAEAYAQLINRIGAELGLPCVLVTADMPVAGAVACGVKGPLANIAGKTNIKQLIAILRDSCLHICGDTGSAHIAAAVGTPVVALFGPTDADRLAPYGQRAQVITARHLCAPGCSPTSCRRHGERCLESITVDCVIQHVGSVLEQRRRTGPATHFEPTSAAEAAAGL
ncbi:MAG: glycosyltransferase family 9 protein [Armatimonadetes bacterium]|nr:glycosyltransferase family 9 protein [Armatimonadota bacterium]MDE2207732.1 glycosyltransferase family 9 protein [Armatimonadota bacterium]